MNDLKTKKVPDFEFWQARTCLFKENEFGWVRLNAKASPDSRLVTVDDGIQPVTFPTSEYKERGYKYYLNWSDRRELHCEALVLKGPFAWSHYCGVSLVLDDRAFPDRIVLLRNFYDFNSYNPNNWPWVEMIRLDTYPLSEGYAHPVAKLLRDRPEIWDGLNYWDRARIEGYLENMLRWVL